MPIIQPAPRPTPQYSADNEGAYRSMINRLLTEVVAEISQLRGADDDDVAEHTHDDLYYTEAEVDDLVASKADTGHTHHDLYYTEAEVDALIAGKSDVGHTHHDLYYTEAEVDALIAGKSDVGHTHAASAVTAGTFGAGAFTFQDALAVQDRITAQWLTLEGMGTSTSDAAIEIVRHSAAGTYAYRSKQTGDAFERFWIRPDGMLLWGSGTAAADLNLQRTAVQTLTCSNTFQARSINLINAAGTYGIMGSAVLGPRRTGWASAPTGTATRTTFDTATVTLPQLAERVKALLDDLRAHGMIGA